MHRILVIDDEPSIRKAVALGLASEDFEVDVAADGNSGILIGTQKEYDVLVADLCLPDMDGLEVIEQIMRSSPEIIPIIITGKGTMKSSIEAIRLEVEDYLEKPFSMESVKNSINRGLEKRALKQEKMQKKLQEVSRIFKEKPQEIETSEQLLGTIPWLFQQINNPLMSIMTGSAKLAVRDLNDEMDIRNYIKDIIEATEKISSINKEIMKVGQRADGKTEGINIRDISEEKPDQERVRQRLSEVQKRTEGVIRAISLTVETRDPYTAGHQKRVAALARSIAEEMGLSKEQTEGIYMAAVIHDIGKICVPAEILSKPGRLTDTELDLIKQHPQVGYNILKEIEFPWPVAQIALKHHESMNGSGYPLGLSGEEIILEARILSVADVVEAMASHRPYRAALGIDKALEEIVQEKGTLYDPQVVDACVTLFTEKGFKFVNDK